MPPSKNMPKPSMKRKGKKSTAKNLQEELNQTANKTIEEHCFSQVEDEVHSVLDDQDQFRKTRSGKLLSPSKRKAPSKVRKRKLRFVQDKVVECRDLTQVENSANALKAEIESVDAPRKRTRSGKVLPILPCIGGRRTRSGIIFGLDFESEMDHIQDHLESQQVPENVENKEPEEAHFDVLELVGESNETEAKVEPPEEADSEALIELANDSKEVENHDVEALDSDEEEMDEILIETNFDHYFEEEPKTPRQVLRSLPIPTSRTNEKSLVKVSVPVPVPDLKIIRLRKPVSPPMSPAPMSPEPDHSEPKNDASSPVRVSTPTRRSSEVHDESMEGEEVIEWTMTPPPALKRWTRSYDLNPKFPDFQLSPIRGDFNQTMVVPDTPAPQAEETSFEGNVSNDAKFSDDEDEVDNAVNIFESIFQSD